MKIIVDAFGGDNSPEEIVKGAIEAVREREGFDVALVGKENAVRSILQKETDYDASRVSVVNADDVITCEESPPPLRFRLLFQTAVSPPESERAYP